MLSVTACGGTAAEEAATAKEAAATKEAATAKEAAATDETGSSGEIKISFQDHTEEVKAKDGTLLVTVKTTLPEVEIPGNESAASAINEYMQTIDLTGITMGDAREWAQSDYEVRGADNWNAYAIETKYTAERADSAVISFAGDAYSYMGGAHPNALRGGYNFDPAAGRRYTLADVVREEQSARESILAFLTEETAKEQYADMLFEDYTESLGDVLTEDTWYLGADGFHIIVNEYIISPHAAGIMDFVLPYEKADFLKENFILD